MVTRFLHIFFFSCRDGARTRLAAEIGLYQRDFSTPPRVPWRLYAGEEGNEIIRRGVREPTLNS